MPDLEKYSIKTNKQHNNGGRLYLIDGYLYKYYDEVSYFIEEKERNIDFFISHPITNTPRIFKKIEKDGKFNGYIMEYINDSKTLREGMQENMSLENKLSIISDIYKSLRELHELNVCLGDIHMDNFLFRENQGLIIDLDEIRFPGDEFKFRECYLIKEYKGAKTSKKATKITDNIKVAICCLSFLYQIDLEEIIMNESLQEVKDKLKSILSPEEYIKVESVLDLNNLYYLDEVLCEQNHIKK